MKCPVCEVDLMMADRQGIEIDYCPKCRGVWLDRGELDRLIERASAAAPQPQRRDYEDSRERRAPTSYREEDSRHHGHPKHKRNSFLSEIFDFD